MQAAPRDHLPGRGLQPPIHSSSTISKSEQNKNKDGNSSQAIQELRLHLPAISTLTGAIAALSLAA
jgi:hypothetical protein